MSIYDDLKVKPPFLANPLYLIEVCAMLAKLVSKLLREMLAIPNDICFSSTG